MDTATYLRSFVIFTSLCLASPTRADPKYVPRIIPKCEVQALKSGETGCVYNLEQVKELYKIDSELFSLRASFELQKAKSEILSSSLTKVQEQSRLSLTNVKLFKDRNAELTTQLIESDRKLQLELARPRWGSYIAWGVAAVLAASFTGYVIADRIN